MAVKVDQTYRCLDLAKCSKESHNLLIFSYFHMKKSKSKNRINKLLKILKKIYLKDTNNIEDLDKLYPLDKTEREQMLMKDLNNAQELPRGEYENPLDRSSYNYQYMTIGEIGSGTPNVW